MLNRAHARLLFRWRKWIFDEWGQARGWLTAFEAASGKMKWRYAASKPLLRTVAATAGDVVLTGELKVIWSL